MRHLACHPDETVSWEAFKREPAPAAALDGYVAGPTRANSTHATFDHHAEVDRLATRATCEQVAVAIRFGPLPVLADPGRLTVHVNHADEDVALSVWLLDNQDRVGDQRIWRLVHTEGILDTTGGCCVPAEDRAFIEQLAWIFAPCGERRTTTNGMADTIATVGERLDRYAEDRAQREPAGVGYRLIERRGRIAAIEEHGVLSRVTLAADGIDLYVSVRELSDRHEITIGKTSPRPDFDLSSAFEELNLREEAEPGDAWGGSSMIGGSPRASGTHLPLPDILDVLERTRTEATGPFLVETGPLPDLY